MANGNSPTVICPAMLVIELEVNDVDPRYNFNLIESLHEQYPGTPVTIAFGEYDDDHRELWQIKEVRGHIAALLKIGLESGVEHWQPEHFTSVFCEQTFSVFGLCMNHEKVRRGESGKYYIFREGA